MSEHNPITLGVNVDHIATLRQARGVAYPDPAQAAELAASAGADGITVHLREDRRHIQDDDVYRIKRDVDLPLNLEMAATTQMKAIALEVRPHEICLVPEKRQELTTEGGLDVVGQVGLLSAFIKDIQNEGILVSLFIDADEQQIKASAEVGADIIELHTGCYAEVDGLEQTEEYKRIKLAAKLGAKLGLQVNAGHGLHYQNTKEIAKIPELACLNIGHAIVARACMTGFHEAVFSMKSLMNTARLDAS